MTAESPSSNSSREHSTVIFDLDVIPVLTKAGCNAASCHGAAAGRGGFRLSLFGGDPAFDFDSITRQLRGRRVNLSNPEQSLLLRKPLGEMDHEGGVRFEADSADAEVLTRWITHGASRIAGPQLEHIEIVPNSIESETVPADAKLQVQATFSDGTQRDVTSWSVFQSDDVATASVEENGTVFMKRRGRCHLVVSYLSKLAVIPVSVPFEGGPAANLETANLETGDTSWGEGNWVDRPINATLKQLGIVPSPRARSTALLRRVSIGLTGKLPTPESVAAFVAAKPELRYEHLVDELMDSPQFNTYWAFHLSRLLRVRAPIKEPQVTRALHQWLESQVADDASWSQMVREMVAANGDTHTNGPAVLHRLTGDARSEAEYVSEVFMGVRLRCANCHNHPLDTWTQDDYHGLAAVFARVRRGRNISTLPSGEVSHPATGAAAIPKIPGNRYLSADDDPRTDLADWFHEDPDQMLAKAFVNRVWRLMMGRGLVEPVDDLRASNPATHPALLQALTLFFIENDYRLRPLLRAMVMSNAYQRGGANDSNRFDVRFNSHFLETTLDPAVLLDATTYVTGVRETFEGEPDIEHAVALPNPSAPSPALDLLGRCPVDENCEEGIGGASLELPRVLHLINGDLLNERIAAPTGHLHQMIRDETSPSEIIKQMYLLACSRYPSEAERAYWEEQLGQVDEQDIVPLLEDFVWGLLNSREFRTNH